MIKENTLEVYTGPVRSEVFYTDTKFLLLQIRFFPTDQTSLEAFDDFTTKVLVLS